MENQINKNNATTNTQTAQAMRPIVYRNEKSNSSTTLSTANGYAINGDQKIAVCTSDCKSYYIRIDGKTFTAYTNNDVDRNHIAEGYEMRIAKKADNSQTHDSKGAKTTATRKPRTKTLADYEIAVNALTTEQQSITDWLNDLPTLKAKKETRQIELANEIETAKQELQDARKASTEVFAKNIATDANTALDAVKAIAQASGLTAEQLATLLTSATPAPTAK